MMLVEATPIPAEALPVMTLKDHLRLGTGFADESEQDALLENQLRAAIATIEARTGKVLLTRGFAWTLAAWRDATRQPLPLAPVESVQAVTLIDRNGGETPLAEDRWALEPDMQRPHLKALRSRFPSAPLGGTLRIDLIAGFGAEWGALPKDLAQAVLLLAAQYYENRQGAAIDGAALPPAVSALIEPYRTVRLFMGGRS